MHDLCKLLLKLNGNNSIWHWMYRWVDNCAEIAYFCWYLKSKHPWKCVFLLIFEVKASMERKRSMAIVCSTSIFYHHRGYAFPIELILLLYLDESYRQTWVIVQLWIIYLGSLLQCTNLKRCVMGFPMTRVMMKWWCWYCNESRTIWAGQWEWIRSGSPGLAES